MDDKFEEIKDLSALNKKLHAANQKLKLELMKSKDENHLNSLVNSLQKTNEDLISKLELKDQLMQTNQQMIETLRQKA